MSFFINEDLPGNTESLDLDPDVCEVIDKTATSVVIYANNSATNGVYTVTVFDIKNNSSRTVTSTSKNISVTGLQAGYSYNFSVRLQTSESVYGNTVKSDAVTTNQNSISGNMVSGGKYNPLTGKVDRNTTDIKSAKQYLELTNSDTATTWVTTYKDFTAIDSIPASTTNNAGLKSYEERFYSFGTSIFVGSVEGQGSEQGGIGFFLNDSGTNGYYVILETAKSAAAADRKSVRIMKARGDKLIALSDNQSTPQSTFAAIYSAKQYDIDIKVRVVGIYVYITAIINGFKVYARDTSVAGNEIYAPTQKVGLCVKKGTMLFDYVFANVIDSTLFNNPSYNINFYTGQFANDTIDTAFGNLIYDAMAESDTLTTEYKNKIGVEEFGTVVREIIHVKQKFPQRPAKPVRWSTGDNPYARIIGSEVSPFGGEVFVLNNSSTTIPLSDGSVAAFYCIGNSISPSGQLEYSTDEVSEYNYKEPVIFESKWLQNESDVKSLAAWIKSHVINKGRIIEMEVFGNPLVSVGEKITISYTPLGIDSSEVFIVTAVNNVFSEGLSTTITCRTL